MIQLRRDKTDTQQLDDRTVVEEPGTHQRPMHRARVRRSAADEVDPAYRGFKGGAAFFGWLVAVGLIALLSGIVGAVAAAVDYAMTIDWNAAESEAGTIGVVSGAVLLLILAIAYYSGGYVAGRLARFDGGRQGFGVWLIGVLVTLAVAAVAALAGSQYDVLGRVELPSVPVTEETLTAGGVIAIGAAVLVTLFAAVIGGKAGQRYHRRIDVSAD
jgi:heme/copper-type cytochrome/quinol oxidase subunit 1